MKSKTHMPARLAPRRQPRPAAFPAPLLAVSLLVLALAGCKHGEDPTQVAGWTLVNPSERHPILVSQQPENHTVRVARGSQGLTPNQRAELISFARSARASDAGNSRLIISAPSGGSNEVASMDAVQEIRRILSDIGFPEDSVVVEAYHEDRNSSPPIRISYLRYVAEGPQCGNWPTNLAYEPQNLPQPNLGCATQRNFAAMVANPGDLLGPRTEGERSGERRNATWQKYIKGDVTTAKKAEDEKVKTEGAN